MLRLTGELWTQPYPMRIYGGVKERGYRIVNVRDARKGLAPPGNLK